jgi:serine phosphatase RsbU (regulator of sigma subunit)
VVEKCRELLDAEGAAILLLDPERDELYFPWVADATSEIGGRLRSLRFPADRGIAGAVLRAGAPLRVDDVSSDPRFYADVDRQTGVTTRALLCAPLRTRQGTIGVIQVVNARPGAAFTDDQLAFLEALAASIAVAIENARLYTQLKQQYVALEQGIRDREQLLAIRRELDIARDIQQSILPRTFPPFPDRAEFDVFAGMVPAREVGGDFYDFFLIDDARLGLVVGDVSGKGVPAALFMAVSRTLLRSVALTGMPPAECLSRVNALLCLDNSAEMFVTVFYAILNVRSGELAYGSGGHPPAYVLRREGVVEPLEGTGGTVLGFLDDLSYRAKQAVLRAGDGVFLYTDGVTEAMDGDGTLFSDERLQAVLARQAGASPEAIVRAVVDAVGRHAGNVPQSDDITTLAVRWRG